MVCQLGISDEKHLEALSEVGSGPGTPFAAALASGVNGDVELTAAASGRGTKRTRA